MQKTKHIAFKAKCYWANNGTGWYSSDFKGRVYEDGADYWLRTPTGYVRVTEKDFIGETDDNFKTSASWRYCRVPRTVTIS